MAKAEQVSIEQLRDPCLRASAGQEHADMASTLDLLGAMTPAERARAAVAYSALIEETSSSGRPAQPRRVILAPEPRRIVLTARQRIERLNDEREVRA